MTGQKWNCPTCGSEVRGWLIGRPCNACELEGICKMLVARAEQAERERDEARAQAVWAEAVFYPEAMDPLWRAYCPPGGVWLGSDGWGRGEVLNFPTEAEALAAGRALPWWKVIAQ